MKETTLNYSARYVSVLLAGLLVLVVLCIVFLSLVPPVSKDELVHHLAVPKLYLKHGAMIELPFMPFSYYPMNLDLLYLIPLYFGNDIIPKFIHFSFALLTAGLLFGYLKRRTGAGYALFGAVFFLSVPIMVKLSISAYVDLGVLFFSFASLLLLLKWSESGFRGKFLIFSGVMAGLAVGTKYNALVTMALLTLFVPILSARRAKGSFYRSAAHGLLFLLVALLVFSPWMARNYAWKQNPVYPLFDRAFNPPKNGDSEATGGRADTIRPGLGVFVIREGIYHETWWEIALVPLRIFFEGEDGSPKHFDGKLNPFLFLFPGFAFWRMREEQEGARTEKKILLAFVVLFFAIAFFTSDLRIRYIAPIIPVLVVLTVLGAEKLHRAIEKQEGRLGKHVAFALLFSALAWALAYNGRYVVAQFKEVEPFGYISGAVSRDAYLERHRPEYAAVRFINRDLPQDAKVMLLFLGDRGYYCDRDYVLGEGLLGTLFLESKAPADILAGLEREKVTHLFISAPFFKRWAGTSLSDVEKNKLNEFFGKYTRILFNRNGFYVLGLLKSLD
jgi:4-amino-4-deoxy-L-arabinose transferase-like glycosyltransferase